MPIVPVNKFYRQLAFPDPSQLVFGRSANPVSCGFDLIVGNGEVYPEVNFTLPVMEITAETHGEITTHYSEMIRGVLRRARSLQVPGLMVEFELLPAMTENPSLGSEITSLLVKHLRDAHEATGLRCALRVTPTDIREAGKPPLLRSGTGWEKVKETFAGCIEAGAHLVSIESVGGKEVHDQALVQGDLRGILFALGVLAPRDMTWLWNQICLLCRDGGSTVPAGDTACGFANTAMQLAHQKMLPEVLAAVVRAMSAVRSLAAFEQGAVGPSKDCAYEGPILKAITGCPISMEGKSAACAHFSPLGNIAAAMCDLWSNESVQNVRLLSGSAPEAFAELLIYDCRLMNAALSQGGERTLRDWMIQSDQWLSPQAAVLSPEAVVEIAQAIVNESDAYRRTLSAGRTALGILRRGSTEGRLKLAPREAQWLARLESDIDAMPESEEVFLREMSETYRGVYDPASYGLTG